LGVRENSTDQLQQAVAAYREALKEYSRDKVPLDWAATQNNLGTALRALGAPEQDPSQANQFFSAAIVAFQGAIEVYQSAQAEYYLQIAQNNLKKTKALLVARQGQQLWRKT